MIYRFKYDGFDCTLDQDGSRLKVTSNNPVIAETLTRAIASYRDPHWAASILKSMGAEITLRVGSRLNTKSWEEALRKKGLI